MATNTSLSARISKRTGTCYAVALLATLVALLVRRALNPFLGDYVPYITLFPAVAFCAWYCGIGPPLLSVVLAPIGAKYWFIPPAHTPRIIATPHVVGILSFLLVSSALVALGAARPISPLLRAALPVVARRASALCWYTERFAQRNTIKVDLEVPADFGRL